MRMAARNSATVLNLKCTLRVRAADAGNLFVKLENKSIGKLDREATCIEILKGLGVPAVVRLPRRALPTVFQQDNIRHIAFADAGTVIDKSGLSARQLLGAWMFIVEQLAAFRIHQIIYTDVKCANVVIKRRPNRVTIIDFGNACYLVGGKADLSRMGVTPGALPPDLIYSEQSAVFQAGLLLPHILAKVDTRDLPGPSRNLTKFRRILRRAGAPEFENLIMRCLAANPARRPRNYIALHEEIRAIGGPPSAIEFYNDLRSSFAARLEDLGLRPILTGGR